jgi:protein-disulfide isomerase
MSRQFGWLVVLILLALVLAACGPEMATPTPVGEVESTSQSPSAAPAEETAGAEPNSTSPPAASADLPVDADDWHVLGSPDAAVTIVEYSDYQ